MTLPALLDEDKAKRQRLHSIQALLRGEAETLHGDLRDVEAPARNLVQGLASCEAAGLLVKFSMDDWLADASSRGAMLAHMLPRGGVSRMREKLLLRTSVVFAKQRAPDSGCQHPVTY